MSRERLLILTGLLVVFSPFSGLPLAILSWILPVLGITVVCIGILAVRERRATRELPHQPV